MKADLIKKSMPILLDSPRDFDQRDTKLFYQKS